MPPSAPPRPPPGSFPASPPGEPGPWRPPPSLLSGSWGSAPPHTTWRLCHRQARRGQRRLWGFPCGAVPRPSLLAGHASGLVSSRQGGSSSPGRASLFRIILPPTLVIGVTWGIQCQAFHSHLFVKSPWKSLLHYEPRVRRTRHGAPWSPSGSAPDVCLLCSPVAPMLALARLLP